MPLSRTRDYLSIGEVLDAVRADFPDVSISKIRFLESEGLLEPERTQSGYRKFYAKDVERLRFILTLQRDHFMPLKVIRERIDAGDTSTNGSSLPPEIAAPAAREVPAGPGAPAQDVSEVQLSRSELLAATGLSEADLLGLEDFGILPKSEGPYQGSDLTVAKAAKGLIDLGIEPRHLRMYRQFADREVGFFEQLLMPSMHRKDPDAARSAGESLRKLEALSRSMHDGLLRAALRDLL